MDLFPGPVTPVTVTPVLHCHHGSVSWSSNTSDCNTGTLLATLPGTWCSPANTGAGWTSVSILLMGEIKKFGQQLLPQCGSTYIDLSRSVPEIHQPDAGTFSKQPTTASSSSCRQHDVHVHYFIYTQFEGGVAPSHTFTTSHLHIPKT